MIDTQLSTSYSALKLTKPDSAAPRAKDRVAPAQDSAPKATQGPGYTTYVVAPFTLVAAQEARDLDEIRRDDVLREDEKRRQQRADDTEDQQPGAQNTVANGDTAAEPTNVVRFTDYVDADTPPPPPLAEPPRAYARSDQADQAAFAPGLTPRDFAKANAAYTTGGAVDGRNFIKGDAGTVYSHSLEVGFDVVV